MAEAGERAGAPVICVGNFVAGGAGKTPAAIALAQMLIADGKRVAFLSRGYGGAKRAEPVEVDPNVHDAARCRRRAAAARPGRAVLGRRRSRAKRAEGGRSGRGGARSSTTGCRIRRSRRTSPSRWSTARRASATGSAFRPGLCARRLRRRRPSCGRSSSSAATRRRLQAIGQSVPRKPILRASLEPDALAAGAADRPGGRRLRRHRAAGQVLRDAAPRRRADRRDPRLSGPPSFQAPRDRGADRGGGSAGRASGDDREGPRAPVAEIRPRRRDPAGDAALRGAATGEGNAAPGLPLKPVHFCARACDFIQLGAFFCFSFQANEQN